MHIELDSFHQNVVMYSLLHIVVFEMYVKETISILFTLLRCSHFNQAVENKRS